MPTLLRYRHNASVSDLEVDECTMHRAGDSKGARWWLLWFRVNRDSDGVAEDFAAPMNPNGTYIEEGPGGKTWALTRIAAHTWRVSPSINVLDTRDLHDGEHERPSLWHQTPDISGVPDDAPWVSERP